MEGANMAYSGKLEKNWKGLLTVGTEKKNTTTQGFKKISYDIILP